MKNYKIKLGYGCKCETCLKHEQDKHKMIMACKCKCHEDDVAVEHDSLCCGCPNIKKLWLDSPDQEPKECKLPPK